MKKIPLSRGLLALVDDEDFDRVNQFKWYAQSTSHSFYAARRLPTDEGGGLVLLHRWVVNAPAGVKIDHKNRDSLDCQKLNLRIATHAQNLANVGKQRGEYHSQYKGVCWVGDHINKTNHWLAYVGSGATRQYLGYHYTEEDAARAYDQAAKKRYGEFAGLNFT